MYQINNITAFLIIILLTIGEIIMIIIFSTGSKEEKDEIIVINITCYSICLLVLSLFFLVIGILILC